MATGQYLSELAAALAEKGHEVTVVSGRRAYDHPEKLFPARETWRGVRIFRVSSTRFGKQAKWRRAADFASFILSCCARLAFLPRHDVVVALTTPPLISFIGAWRAKFWRAGFCYWVMDMNPDEAIAAGWLRADSFVGKMLERMSRFSLRRADKIIALDRFMRDRIIAKGIAPEKIAVIPPWSQDADVRFDAAGREQFRSGARFAGQICGDVFRQPQPGASAGHIDAGGGAVEGRKIHRLLFHWRRERIQARAALGGSRGKRDNVLCLPYQPLAQLSASLSAADAHVVVMGDAMLGLVHPCKIYNILAVGAPVIYIGPKPSHVTEILDQLGDEYPSIRVAHGEADLLADQIQKLRQKTAGGRRPLPTEVTARFFKRRFAARIDCRAGRISGRLANWQEFL